MLDVESRSFWICNKCSYITLLSVPILLILNSTQDVHSVWHSLKKKGGNLQKKYTSYRQKIHHLFIAEHTGCTNRLFWHKAGAYVCYVALV